MLKSHFNILANEPCISFFLYLFSDKVLFYEPYMLCYFSHFYLLTCFNIPGNIVCTSYTTSSQYNIVQMIQIGFVVYNCRYCFGALWAETIIQDFLKVIKIILHNDFNIFKFYFYFLFLFFYHIFYMNL